jgi:hypothetical protein
MSETWDCKKGVHDSSIPKECHLSRWERPGEGTRLGCPIISTKTKKGCYSFSLLREKTMGGAFSGSQSLNENN